MRTVFLACMLTMASTSAALATTIDFAEFTSQVYGDETMPVITQGFKFTSAAFYITEVGEGTNMGYIWCPTCTMTLERADGSAFSISSADFSSGSTTAMSVTGYLSGGGTVQSSVSSPSWSSVNFGSEWTNLQRIEFGYLNEFGQGIDNIVVTAVPVPPAIWLFGSALLGLMRWRKRAQPAL